jgi:hypothetical protein
MCNRNSAEQKKKSVQKRDYIKWLNFNNTSEVIVLYPSKTVCISAVSEYISGDVLSVFHFQNYSINFYEIWHWQSTLEILK